MNPESSKIKTFTDLHVWQEGHQLVIAVYEITKQFPKEEIFSLVNQMRRAAVSITSNIAEGFGRNSYRERIQFYRIAHGSLTELTNQLLVARDVRYTSLQQYDGLETLLTSVHRLLNGLIRKSKSFVSAS